MFPADRTRAVTPVVGIALLVAVAVVLAGVVSIFALDFGESTQPDAPTMAVTYELVEDGAERTVAVTHAGGDTVAADHLTVVGTADLDVGGSPSSATPADEQWASSRERFDEGGDQVGVGDTWDSGETVYVDPEGSVDDVTIRFVWSEGGVTGANPGRARGESSFVIAEVVVGG